MTATTQRDLLGDVVIVITNGGRYSRRSRVRTGAVADETAA